MEFSNKNNLKGNNGKWKDFNFLWNRIIDRLGLVLIISEKQKSVEELKQNYK